MTRFTHRGCAPEPTLLRLRRGQRRAIPPGILMLAVGLVGLPAEAIGAEPDSPCTRRGDRIELLLTADEFRIPAYDARRGLVLVQPETELLPGVDRQFSVRLRMPEPQVLMPLGPTGLFLGLSSGASELEMVVVAVPGGHDCAAETRPACDVLEVKALHLKRGDMIISSRRLDQPLEPSVRLRTRVLERVQLDRGELTPPAMARVGARGRALGESCLRKALVRTRAIQGALTVELATSVLGERDSTKVVVDGLVNPEVTRCLLTGFESDAGLWSDLGPATRLYLVLYFRGESVVASSDPPSVPMPPSMVPSIEPPSAADSGLAGP